MILFVFIFELVHYNVDEWGFVFISKAPLVHRCTFRFSIQFHSGRTFEKFHTHLKKTNQNTEDTNERLQSSIIVAVIQCVNHAFCSFKAHWEYVCFCM